MRALRSVLFSAAILPVAAPAQIVADGPMLEAFGGTLDMLLYNTYLAIGSVGDGFEHEAYDAATVGQLMDEQVASLSTVNAQLEKLDDMLVLEDESDRAFVRDAMRTMDDLGTMARSMKTYAGSLEGADAEAFQSARTSAWDRISALLRLGAEDE